MRRLILLLPLLAVSCTALTYQEGSVYFEGEAVGCFSQEVPSGVSFTDCVVEDDGLLKITRTFSALEDIDSVRLSLDFVHSSASSFSMIPSVCYDGNRWGRGNEPKGFATDGVTHTYSYRRTPIPGATYSEGVQFAVAMWSDVPSSPAEEFSCSILPTGASVTHSLILPEEERPFTYISRDTYGDGYARKMSLKKGDKVDMTAYLFVSPVREGHRSMGDFLTAAWNRADKGTMAPEVSSEYVWEKGVAYALNSLWAEEGPYRGFSIGLQLYDGEWDQRRGWKYEVGWCGQNASFANSLLTDYIRYGRQESLERALTCIDTWCSDSLFVGEGLYVTNYDYILDNDMNPVSDACNLGTAARNFFECAALLDSAGRGDAAVVRSTAFRILDFVRERQHPDGCYGKGWNAAGECVAKEGTVGAFLISPMLMAYRLGGDEGYLTSAKGAYAYYFSEFDRNGYTTAGALDTWCIDKESSISLLRASLELYALENDGKYLEDARRLAFYLSTWIWHYRENYPRDSDMTRYDYDTFGATAVSVQHHHLDYYAVLFVPELLRLYELTSDCQWLEKARAIWNNACQLISDGSLEINGHLRPEGSQNEAYLHCNWGWDGYPGAHRINDWLVAWPGAFRLEVLRKVDAEYLSGK